MNTLSWGQPQDSTLCMTGRAHVTDVDVNDGGQQSKNNSGIAFSVIRTEHWERAMSHAQHDHERKRAIHQDEVKGAVKALQAHERGASIPRTHTLSFPCLVRDLRHRPRAQTKDSRNSWWTRNTFLELSSTSCSQDVGCD